MPVKFSKLDYFISEFNRLIVDDNIKEFILGSDDFKRRLKSSADYLSYMNNCITLAYLYAYGCYRQLAEYSEYPDDDFKDYIPEKDNNSTRLLNSLKKTYVQYPLTAELIQYVVLDVQFDMLPGSPQNLNGIFGKVCNFSQMTADGDYFNLVKYFNYIAKWRLSPTRFDELDNDQLIELFLDLITNMEFLHGHLCQVEGDFVLVSPKFYNFAASHGALEGDVLDMQVFDQIDARPFVDFVPMRHTIIRGDNRKTFGLYYLCNIERKLNLEAVDLTYVHSIGFGNLFVRAGLSCNASSLPPNFEIFEYDAADYYYEITGALWNQAEGGLAKKKEKNLIDQVHTINYKYIKNLALATSDAISRFDGSKKILERAFAKKHPSLFSGFDSNMGELDGIVIMLMIEESPTRVLEVLFSGNEQLFHSIVVNIDRRFDDKTLAFHKKTKRELAGEVDRLIKERLLIGEHNMFKVAGGDSRKANIEKLRPMAQALLVVSSLSKLVEEERRNEYIYAGNIYSTIETLKGLKGNPDVTVKIDYVRNILIDTFKHLICFYEGVYAYGDKKSNYDLESMNTCLPRARIEAIQKILVDEFMNAAKQRAEAFKNDPKYTDGDVLVYIDDFTEICNRCYLSNSTGERTYREKLYSAVGKYEIIDFEVFSNCLSTWLGNNTVIDANSVNHWIDFALVIMEYFKTGSFSDTPVDHRLMDAIYPFAASYSKRNENRDGQITVTFSISIDIDNDGVDDYRREINVLTEFSYNLQEVFYCLPNVQRSNDRWWIDPLLISFTSFNSIFE